MASAMTESASLPLARTLHVGMRGRDVSAMQRALRAWNPHVRASGPTGVFGAPTQVHVKRFQESHRIPPTGWYGPATHGELARYYDAYGHWLVEMTQPAQNAAEATRRVVVEAAYLCYRNRAVIHYTQDMGLRMQGVVQRLRLPRFPVWADCSSFATWCYYAAGAPDPNGRSYDGFGFTGTLFPRGAHVVRPEPGDLVFYGPGPYPGHVAVYVGDGLVISHGSEGGPYLVPRNYRADEVGIRSYLPV